MSYAEKIAERVKMGRDELELSQSDLAKRAGVSRATVARIEGGSAESVAFGTILRVLNAANWSLYFEKGIAAPTNSSKFDMEAYLNSLYGSQR